MFAANTYVSDVGVLECTNWKSFLKLSLLVLHNFEA